MSSWRRLTEELECWHSSGTIATFWWRDDDAIDVTPQLDRLLRCAGSIPVSLAVIPSRASRALADRIGGEQSIAVLQHGWAHVSHLSGGQSEYPSSRTDEEVSRELVEGRAILLGLFGTQAIPIFVPPYHAFDPRFVPLLARNGFKGISRKGPRQEPPRVDGLVEVNAHVSPITWSKPPAFAGDDTYLDRIVEHLHGCRVGRYDAAEPTGLLTHHLDQNAESFAFIARFAEVVSEHPGATWLSAKEIFDVHRAPTTSSPASASAKGFQ